MAPQLRSQPYRLDPPVTETNLPQIITNADEMFQQLYEDLKAVNDQLALDELVIALLPAGGVGFTEGSILFIGSGGTVITQDNAHLFWDDANNRLGVGTNVPLAGVHIAAPDGNASLQLERIGGESWLFQVGGSGALTLNDLTLGFERLRVSLTGDVSIPVSVTTPVVIGGTTTTSTLTLRSTSGVGVAGADIVFQVGNNGATEAMRIINSGLVGIGIALPVVGLHVFGTTAVTAAIILERQANGAGGPPFTFRKTRAAGAIVQSADVLGSFSFAGADGTGSFPVGASIRAEVDGTPGVGSVPGRLMFLTTAEAMRIDSAGRVGIGLTPTAVLHIKAGTATASSAPIKLTSGVVLTTAEAGAIEFTTDDFFATITTGAARKAFVLDDGARLTSGKIPVATTNGRLVNLTASSAYTPTNVTTDRSYDANATTLDELADVVGTIIADLQTKGVLG